MSEVIDKELIKRLKYANEFQSDLFFFIDYIKEHSKDDFLKKMAIENENKWKERGLKEDG